jgi:hypothetical protein
MNEQISGRLIGAGAASIIQNLKPVLIDQEFTKMSTNIERFSYALKLVTLTHMYMELSLPLPAALRAAESDLLYRKNHPNPAATSSLRARKLLNRRCASV